MFIDELLMGDNIISKINQNMDTLLYYIPEIRSMIGFDQKHPHHNYDLWNHTLLALYNAEVQEFNDLDVRFALLLHDIGKTECFVEGQVRRYYNHSIYSSKIAQSILERLGYSNEFKNLVLYLIKNHDSAMSDELIKDNSVLAEKLYEVQYCDSFAHNPKYLKKRLDYLTDAKKRIIKRGR